MLVPIGFIIDAYKGIGFKVCEEETNITTLRRGGAGDCVLEPFGRTG